MRAADSDDALVECFDRQANRCVITPVCRLRGVLATAIDAFYAALDAHTLADITRNREPLAQMLFARRGRLRRREPAP